MRIYRLQVRIIQLSVLLAVIVMALGVFNIWQGEAGGPAGDQPAGQSGSSSNNPNPGGSPGGNGPDEQPKEPVNSKIVCLGDSFTNGYPGDKKDSWPEVMAGILKTEVVNAGVVYQNSQDLLKRFEQDVAAHKPGRVIIFAGVGDAIRGIDLETYKKNVEGMVAKAKESNIEPILALPIPYPGTDSLYERYLAWETQYALDQKIRTLDFKRVLFDENGKIIRKYSDDGKYPNKEGYKVMGEYAAQIMSGGQADAAGTSS